MADPAFWPEQADVERKLRNAAGLLMLGNPDGTGTLDPNFLANCLASARGRVCGAVMVKHAASVLDALDAETVADLKRIAVVYAAAVAMSSTVTSAIGFLAKSVHAASRIVSSWRSPLLGPRRLPDPDVIATPVTWGSSNAPARRNLDKGQARFDGACVLTGWSSCSARKARAAGLSVSGR